MVDKSRNYPIVNRNQLHTNSRPADVGSIHRALTIQAGDSSMEAAENPTDSPVSRQLLPPEKGAAIDDFYFSNSRIDFMRIYTILIGAFLKREASRATLQKE